MVRHELKLYPAENLDRESQSNRARTESISRNTKIQVIDAYQQALTPASLCTPETLVWAERICPPIEHISSREGSEMRKKIRDRVPTDTTK
jgi:hypothetical protein